jgi:hypothetical protein
MRKRLLPLALLMLVAAPAWAEHPAECRVAENLTEPNFRLPHVTRAVGAKHLNILVVGAGSSQLPGTSGTGNAYPARLQQALAASKPVLLVWQTGTVDAMLGVDPDLFSQSLDKGIKIARSAGADVVLINAQYSPRTESMIALGTYVDDMRWVALQQEVPLFDRFSIMKLWGELGTFDLYSATKKLDIAERVHDCIGRLLADMVVSAAKPEEQPTNGSR